MFIDIEELCTAKILVVEDDAVTLELIEKNLLKFNDINLVTTGNAAIEFCQNHAPDIILLDVNLPDKNGTTVCKILRAMSNCRNCPIIFMTSCEEQGTEMSCWESGATDFLRKPFLAQAIQPRVLNHLYAFKQLQVYHQLLHTDPLTGVFSRYYFTLHYESHLAYAKRYRTDVAVILLDVDYFKKYNDSYGHLAGDDCLKQVAKAISTCVSRPPDMVCRYGGEEFVVVLPGTNIKGGEVVAKRIVDSVSKLQIPHRSSPLRRVTLSAGVSSYNSIVNKGLSLFEHADKNLYKAKHGGRCMVA